MSVHTTDQIAGHEHLRPLNEDVWLVFGLAVAVRILFIQKRRKTESWKLALDFGQWIHSNTAEAEPAQHQSSLDYP